jgi:TatD DNase family protein
MVPEDALVLPIQTTPALGTAVVDTHTHLASTFGMYQQKYPGGRYKDLFECTASHSLLASD